MKPSLTRHVRTRRAAEQLISYQNNELPALESYDERVDDQLSVIRGRFEDRFSSQSRGSCFCCRSLPADGTYCVECKGDLRREVALLKKKHGLPQTTTCAICKMDETRKRLSLDHCHKTGKARGFICDYCNKAISLLDNNPDKFYKHVEALPKPVLISRFYKSEEQ